MIPRITFLNATRIVGPRPGTGWRGRRGVLEDNIKNSSESSTMTLLRTGLERRNSDLRWLVAVLQGRAEGAKSWSAEVPVSRLVDNVRVGDRHVASAVATKQADKLVECTIESSLKPIQQGLACLRGGNLSMIGSAPPLLPSLA